MTGFNRLTPLRVRGRYRGVKCHTTPLELVAMAQCAAKLPALAFHPILPCDERTPVMENLKTGFYKTRLRPSSLLF
jgi:hypothetical protein